MEARVGDLSVPSGYYFRPTEIELTDSYLKNRILGRRTPAEVIPTASDLLSTSPERFPSSDCKYFKESERYFFTKRRNSNNKDDLITTQDGYYIMVSEEEIVKDDVVIGFRNSLAFYRGQPPEGTETQWVVHQYRLNPTTMPPDELEIATPEKVSNFVACRVVNKNLEVDSDEEWMEEMERKQQEEYRKEHGGKAVHTCKP